MLQSMDIRDTFIIMLDLFYWCTETERIRKHTQKSLNLICYQERRHDLINVKNENALFSNSIWPVN